MPRRLRNAALFQRRRADGDQPEGLLRRIEVPSPDCQHAFVAEMVVVVQKCLGGVEEVLAQAVSAGSRRRPGIYLRELNQVELLLRPCDEIAAFGQLDLYAGIIGVKAAGIVPVQRACRHQIDDERDYLRADDAPHPL